MTGRTLKRVNDAMWKFLSNHLLLSIGWLFVFLGAIGAFLPILPTTPFLIVASALFAKSSPRFHYMLLNNNWFGPALKQWEEKKTVSLQTKRKASLLIVMTFSISIAMLYNRIELQVLLLGIAMILLFFIWRLREEALKAKCVEMGEQ